MDMKLRHPTLLVLLLLIAATTIFGAPFGHKKGPDIENIDEISEMLRQDTYDLELLISFGNSKGGSAGHLALGIRDQAEGGTDDLVYSANFYADRKPEHAKGYYNKDLMCIIPKMEYLFKTTSCLGEDASFGLDMGEIYKRSVIGIRISGVPAEMKEQLTQFFHKLNDDFHAEKKKTDYHRTPIVYDYMNLNCAKTIALGFKYGAGFKDLEIKGMSWGSGILPKALTANLPTGTAMNIMACCAKRGYDFDVVLYKKWGGSTYINPHDEEQRPYKDIPNRFPSVFSLDYKSDQGHYEDYDNLFAMYTLYNLGRYSIALNGDTRKLFVEAQKEPDAYDAAVEKADQSAVHDKKHLLRRLVFRAWGIKLGEDADNTHLYDYDDLNQTGEVGTDTGSPLDIAK